MRPQTQANILICLLDHVYQAPFANMKIKRRGWPETPLILGSSGTQYVAMGIKLLSPNCRILLQRMKHFRYKLAEISFFIKFDENLVEYMMSSLG